MNKLKTYYDCFMKDKILKSSLVLLYFMILVIVWNLFCYTIGMDIQLKIDNIRKIFAIEVISYLLYSYLGSLLSLFFMEKKKNYKEIAILTIPLSLVLYLFKDNLLLGNVFLFSFYFLYRYIRNSNIKTIFTTCGYLICIFFIQALFYIVNYKMLNLQFLGIDSSLLKLMLGMDYYIFLSVIILIKNKLIRK